MAPSTGREPVPASPLPVSPEAATAPLAPAVPPGAATSRPVARTLAPTADVPVGATADVGDVLGELAIAAARIGTFELDLRTGRLRWDEQLVELLGEEPGSAPRRTLADFYRRVHDDDVPAVDRAVVEAIASGGELDVVYRVVLAGGESRWIAARGRVLHDEAGNPVRLLGAAHDTTAREEGEALIGRVLETMPTAFFSLDRQWRFTYVNAEAERVLGRTREALLGGDVWELFPAAVGSHFERSYRGAAASGEPVAFDAYYPPPLDAWFEVWAWPGPDGLAVYFLDVTARRRGQEHLAQSVRRAALMARVTAELTETLDGEEAVGRLADLVVPDLADWCIVTLVDEEQRAGTRRSLRDIGWAHRDPADLPALASYADGRLEALDDASLLVRVLATGDPLLVQHRATDVITPMLATAESRRLLHRLAPEVVTILPLRGRGGTVGLISLYSGADRAPLTADELATAREVAGRAGLALDNSRLLRQQRQLAEGLQRSLLTEPPRRPGLEIAVRYVPAAEAAQVGGDWYDAFAQPDGGTVLVIGDVVGHDIAAAAEMGQLRSLLRGVAVSTGAGPARLLGEVDRAMLTLQAGTIATAVVVRMDPPDAGGPRPTTGEPHRPGPVTGHAVRWANAGHPPPMVVHPDGTVAEITREHADLLLGLVPDVPRSERTTTLAPGAILFLYTDGLVERRDEGLADGLTRLRETLRELAGRDLESLCDAVLARLLPDRRTDDVALLAVRVVPAAGAEVPEPA